MIYYRESVDSPVVAAAAAADTEAVAQEVDTESGTVVLLLSPSRQPTKRKLPRMLSTLQPPRLLNKQKQP